MSINDVRDIRAAAPDLAEFVSDYWAILDDEDKAGSRHALAVEISQAWIDQSVSRVCPDSVIQELQDSILPEIEYYLP